MCIIIRYYNFINLFLVVPTMEFSSSQKGNQVLTYLGFEYMCFRNVPCLNLGTPRRSTSLYPTPLTNMNWTVLSAPFHPLTFTFVPGHSLPNKLRLST